MGALEDSDTLLKQSLIKESKPFNYKLLSRKLDVHVDDAKKLLYSFYVKNKDLVQPTYTITGLVRGVSGLTIRLTTDLDEQDKFDRIDSITVYSLSPLNIQVEETITAINEEIRSIKVTEEKLAKWGVIKGPELVKVEEAPAPTRTSTVGSTDSTKSGQPQPVSRASTLPLQSSSSTSPKKKADFPDMGSKAAQMLARFRQREEPKKSSQPTFGRSSTKERPKPKNDTSRRSKTEPSRPTIEVAEDEGLNDEEFTKKQNAAKKKELEKKRALESMFDDDDDDDLMDASTDQVTKDPISVAASPVKKAKLDDLEDIFNSSLTEDQSQTQDATSISPQKAKEDEHVEEATSESQKDSTTSYYDEDGYLVTKVEKPKVKPKPRARTATPTTSEPAVKKSKTTSTPGKQSSLMSFFGKK